jgi:membrane protease YdiL (CAAX protease family)
MYSPQIHGFGNLMQLGASSVDFCVAHAVWGLFRGSLVTPLRVTIVTGALGLALAAVYIASHRVLAPCIVARFLMNVFVEPGLVLSAVKGEMSGSARV